MVIEIVFKRVRQPRSCLPGSSTPMKIRSRTTGAIGRVVDHQLQTWDALILAVAAGQPAAS
jgi:hypothetical protein